MVTNSVEDQQYLVNMPYHLIKGGMAEKLCEILTDYDFFEHKLEFAGIMELVDDYDHVFQSEIPLGTENKKSLSLIQKTLQLSAHVLTDDKAQLSGQLLGRLLAYNLKPIKKLLDQAKNHKLYPHLSPLGPTLISPDAPLLKTIVAHTKGVTAIILTHDGSRLVSACHCIKVWEAANGSFVNAITGHNLAINALALTRDDRYLLSASDDATLKVWDLASGQEMATFVGHVGPVSAVAVTPDGLHVVSAARFSGNRTQDFEPRNNPLMVWSLETGKIVKLLHGHSHSVMTLAMAPDGQLVASGEGRSIGEDKHERYKIRVWNLNKGNESMTAYVSLGPITAMKISPCGQYIVAAITDNDFPRNLKEKYHGSVIKILKLKSGREMMTFKVNDFDSTYPDGLRDFIFLSGQDHLLSLSRDSQFKIFNLKDGSVEKQFMMQERGSFHSLLITPDQTKLIVSSDNGFIKYLDFSSICTKPSNDSRSPSQVGGNGALKPVSLIAITRDGKLAISASREEKEIKVWDVKSQNVLLTFDKHEDLVEAISIMSDGARVISASQDQVVKIWDIRSGVEMLTLLIPPPFHYMPMFSGLAVSADSQYILTPGDKINVETSKRECLILVWDANSGKMLHIWPIKCQMKIINNIKASPIHDYMAVSEMVGASVQLVSISEGKLISTLDTSENVDNLAFTPDGKRLIVSGEGGLSVWDIQKYQKIFTLKEACPGLMRYLVFDVEPEGRYLFCGGSTSSRGIDSCAIEVFDLNCGNLISRFLGDTAVYSIAAASNGAPIVVGTASGQVHFLELNGV